MGLRYRVPSSQGALALELNFASYDTTDFFDPTGAKIAEIDMWSVTLRPKLYLHILDSRLAYYFFMGFGYMEADRKITAGPSSGEEEHDSGFVFEVGSGLEVSITDHVGVFTEANLLVPTGELSDLSLWTVGVGILFRF